MSVCSVLEAFLPPSPSKYEVLEQYCIKITSQGILIIIRNFNLLYLKEEFVYLPLWFSCWSLTSCFIHSVRHKNVPLLRLNIWKLFQIASQYLFKMYKCLYVPSCEWTLLLYCTVYSTSSLDNDTLLHRNSSNLPLWLIDRQGKWFLPYFCYKH